MIIRENQNLFQKSVAHFSDCSKYRYMLTRIWDETLPTISYLLLNPSTADEMVNDPTIERCQRRAVTYGYGQMIIVNLFPFRMTDSTQLHTIENLLGDNTEADSAIIQAVSISEMTVCGWGNHPLAQERARHIFNLLLSNGLSNKLHALDVNNNGSPKHPLYVGYNKHPIVLKDI